MLAEKDNLRHTERERERQMRRRRRMTAAT